MDSRLQPPVGSIGSTGSAKAIQLPFGSIASNGGGKGGQLPARRPPPAALAARPPSPPGTQQPVPVAPWDLESPTSQEFPRRSPADLMSPKASMASSSSELVEARPKAPRKGSRANTAGGRSNLRSRSGARPNPLLSGGAVALGEGPGSSTPDVAAQHLREDMNMHVEGPPPLISIGSGGAPSPARPNPLLAASPKRDSLTDIQIELPAAALGSQASSGGLSSSGSRVRSRSTRKAPPAQTPAEKDFAPAAFLESLLDEEPSPGRGRRPGTPQQVPEKKESDAGARGATRKRPTSMREKTLAVPEDPGGRTHRRPSGSGEPLLAGHDQHDTQGEQAQQPPVHPVQQRPRQQSRPRSVPRQPGAQVVGRQSSRKPVQRTTHGGAQAVGAMEVAPWDDDDDEDNAEIIVATSTGNARPVARQTKVAPRAAPKPQQQQHQPPPSAKQRSATPRGQHTEAAPTFGGGGPAQRKLALPQLAPPTSTSAAADVFRGSVNSGTSGGSSEFSLANTKCEIESPGKDRQDRSPSLGTTDSTVFSSPDKDARKGGQAAFFPEPVKKQVVFDSGLSLAMDGSGAGKKITLSALAGAPKPPLVIRLARLQDLRDAGYLHSAARRSGSAAMGGAPFDNLHFPGPGGLVLPGGAGRPTPQLGEYKELCSELHLQRILDAFSGGLSLRPAVDKKAVLFWYLPYAIIAGVYLQVCYFAGLASEAALAVYPLLVSLLGLHMMRLSWFDRVLWATIDACAASDFRSQLREHAGGFAASGEGMFVASLTSAVRDLASPQGLLLSKPKRRDLPRRPLYWSAWLLSVLCAMRFLRASLGVDEGEDGLTSLATIELVSTVALVVAHVVFGCAPTGMRRRSLEVDVRMAELEAFLNTLLDTLKPLLQDPPRPMPPALGALSDYSYGKGSEGEPVSLRLITSDRRTMRAELRIAPVAQDGAEHVVVSCPIGRFSLVAASLRGLTPTDLGRSAAWTPGLALELAAGSPLADVAGLSLAANPSLSHRGSGSAVAGLSGLSMSAWATAMVSSRQNNPLRSRDDEASLSASQATASTASTLRHAGGGGSKDEAMLHLAMGAVTALSRQRCEPLEVFRQDDYRGISPAKMTMEEPALLLAMSVEDVRVRKGAAAAEALSVAAEAGGALVATPPRRQWLSGLLGGRSPAAWLPSGWSAAQASAAGGGEASVDNFGVLRIAQDLRSLCRSEGPSLLRSPASSIVDGRSRLSTSDSEWSSDDDQTELRKGSPSKAGTQRGKGVHTAVAQSEVHLALVFDSYAERDRCSRLLQNFLKLPEAAG
eukprot:TRINITY_DN22830_c0_g3_i2.p1 TRINITY_DN22830_c0_g3~~TRINITY_DN22830_c0_g3_i2.p1  ORF type:complete len:1290 (+),score=236.41 TRINITY_DN22830_c0_g3_i2:276-4145(+)